MKKDFECQYNNIIINSLQHYNAIHSISINIRFMVGYDLNKIIAIESDSFEYPWLRSDFDLKLSEDGVLCYVIEHQNSVVAYAIVKYYDNYIELCNLAVDSNYRRQKIASFIINILKIKLLMNKMISIRAHVSECNLQAQLFLANNNFIAKRVIHNYYTQGYDSYYMQFDNLLARQNKNT